MYFMLYIFYLLSRCVEFAVGSIEALVESNRMLQTRLDQAASALVAFQQQQEQYHAMFLSFKSELASMTTARQRLEDQMAHHKREVDFWKCKYDQERRRAMSNIVHTAVTTASSTTATSSSSSSASPASPASPAPAASLSASASPASGAEFMQSSHTPYVRSSSERLNKDNRDIKDIKDNKEHGGSGMVSPRMPSLGLGSAGVSKDNREYTSSPRFRASSLSPRMINPNDSTCISPRSEDLYSPTTSPALSPRDFEVCGSTILYRPINQSTNQSITYFSLSLFVCVYDV
jgi:hypothetical protein